MTKIRLTKEFGFEMAHALEGYDGACRELHGHSYRLFVTVRGEPCSDPTDPKYGMVMDFGDLKMIVGRHIVDKYDHALVIRKSNTNRESTTCLKQHYSNIIETDYQPTCENMVADFARVIRPLLPTGIELYRIKLHETATSFAEWYSEDNR